MSRGISTTLQCVQCGHDVRVPTYRTKTFKFCSRSCQIAYRRGQTITKICDICGAEFEAPSFRKNVARYCSRKCYHKARSGSIELECAVCGKAIRRSPCQLKGVKASYCSVECRDIGRKRRHEHPPRNANPKDWFRRRGLLARCARCGYDEHPSILEIHHRDRNRHNNVLSNLEVLCPNCHTLEHYPPPTRP